MIYPKKGVKQTGGATMLMAFVLVISMGLMSIYSSQVTVAEQKISSNHYRTKQGFEAAQAGLDAVLTHLNVAFVDTYTANGAIGDSSSFISAGIVLPTLSQGGSFSNAQAIGSYSIKFKKNSLDPDIVDIEVSGFSGDNQSSIPNQMITQSAIPASLISIKPPTPMISRGSIQIGNGVSIANKTNSPVGDLPKAIWSGNNTQTNFGGVAANIDVISQDGTLDGGTGIYENDANLANLTNDQFFQNFFTDSKQRIKSKAEIINCSNSCSGSDLIDSNGIPISQVIWVDTTNPGGTPGTLNINRAITLGSLIHPVLLIVDGEIKIDDANASLNGIIYTTKDFTNNTGAGNINGSLISEGNISANGTLNFRYENSSLLALKNNTSHYIRIAGSCKDF